MTSNPPETTLFLANELPSHISIGLDLQFYHHQEGSSVWGIKLINSGIHFFHYLNHHQNIRHGFYFVCEECDLILVAYDQKAEIFQLVLFCDKSNLIKAAQNGLDQSLNLTKHKSLLPSKYPFMVNFSSNSNQRWSELVEGMSMPRINAMIDSREAGSSYISATASSWDSSKEENDLLVKALLEAKRKKGLAPGSEAMMETLKRNDTTELLLTHIEERKTIRPNATVQQVTQDFLDKSWYTSHLLETVDLLAELQFCFIGTIILNNYNCCIQWTSIVKLFFLSQKMLATQTPVSCKFLSIIKLHLELLPVELTKGDSSDGITLVNLAEVSTCIADLLNSQLSSEVMRALKEIGELLVQKFGLELHETDDEPLYSDTDAAIEFI